MNGTITVVPDVPSALTAAQIDTNGTASVVLTGTPAAINATLAEGVTYLGELDFTGDDALTVAANDLGNTGIGGLQTAKVSVPICVLSPTEQVSNLKDTINNLASGGALRTRQAEPAQRLSPAPRRTCQSLLLRASVGGTTGRLP